MALIAGIQERLARSDAALGALREALDTGQPAAVLRNVVLHGLADNVKGAVSLELLAERGKAQADLAGVLGVLNALLEGRVRLLGDVADSLRSADGLEARDFSDAWAVDGIRRTELESMLLRLPLPVPGA